MGAGVLSGRPLAIVSLILSFLIAPLGLILSIFARRHIKKNNLDGKGLATAGIVFGAVFSLPFLFLVWLTWALGGFHSNQAASDFKPLEKQLTSLGGKKLCDNGDSGYTIDNSTPWYQAYYKIPDRGDLTSQMQELITGQGFTITQIQHGASSGPYGDEQFGPKSDTLTATNQDQSLDLTINRDLAVPLYCNGSVSKYGQKKQIPPGEAILDFSLHLPTLTH
jgi:hypothetical protein